jgi:hypothetical protein
LGSQTARHGAAPLRNQRDNFASFAPHGSPGLDFCEGMSPESVGEVELFFTDRTTARQNWRQDADRLFATTSTPEGWMARWGDAAGSDNARSWEVACQLAASVRDSLADGEDGWWDDWTAILTPWGCDLTNPTWATIWSWPILGGADLRVRCSQWLKLRTPGPVEWAGLSPGRQHSKRRRG